MIINCSSGGVFDNNIQHFTYVNPLGVYSFYSENEYFPDEAYMLNIECDDTEENINILEHMSWR